jgi:hypothetical protein
MLVVVPAAFGGLGGLGLWASGSFRVNDRPAHALVSTYSADHLDPIPIPQRACPYLDAVRVTAVSAGNATSDLLLEHPTPQALATFKTEYPAKLAAFELALRAAATRSPAQLRAQLTEVAKQVAWGRTLARDAPDVDTFASSSIGSLMSGVSALGYASDLTGNACGFRLWDGVASPLP